MASHRARLAVASVVLAVLLIAGGLTPLPRRMFALDAVLIILALGVPAWWIGEPMDVIRAWAPLLAWVIALTAMWDVASAALTDRAFFAEWWLVYPSSAVFFAALYLFQGLAARIITRREPSRRARPSSPP